MKKGIIGNFNLKRPQGAIDMEENHFEETKNGKKIVKTTIVYHMEDGTQKKKQTTTIKKI